MPRVRHRDARCAGRLAVRRMRSHRLPGDRRAAAAILRRTQHQRRLTRQAVSPLASMSHRFCTAATLLRLEYRAVLPREGPESRRCGGRGISPAAVRRRTRASSSARSRVSTRAPLRTRTGVTGPGVCGCQGPAFRCDACRLYRGESGRTGDVPRALPLGHHLKKWLWPMEVSARACAAQSTRVDSP